MARSSAIIAACICFLQLPFALGLHDKHGLFCGIGSDCYDVLGLEKTATKREIQKAYRALSVQYHPDKSSEEGAEKMFRSIAQAYEVLSMEERKESLDYYLDHPSEYWKAYGDFMMVSALKTDWKMVMVGILIFFSFMHTLFSIHSYNEKKASVKKAIMRNAGIGQGGTKQTLELRRRGLEIAGASAAGASGKKNKRVFDEAFEAAVEQLLVDVHIDGLEAKPTMTDTPVLKLFKGLAMRAKLATAGGRELTDEEKLFKIKQNLGSDWALLTGEEKTALQAAGAHDKATCDAWLKENMPEDDDTAVPAGVGSARGKSGKDKKEMRLRKKTQGERFTSGPE